MPSAPAPETRTPLLVDVPHDATISWLLAERVAADPERTFIEHKDSSGAWRAVTRRAFADHVLAVAKGLVAMGVERGDAVGLQASTRYEWVLLDFAIQQAGAITVPIYPTASARQVAAIRRDADLTALVVESDDQAESARSLSEPVEVLTIDDADSPAVTTLVSRGESVSTEEVRARTVGVHADDVATIVYTSGTTGEPRGVELSHRAFVAHSLNAAAHPEFGSIADPTEHGDARILLFLPLSHVLARHIEMLALACEAVLGLTSPKTLAEDLRSFRPTWLMAVPRVLDTFLNTVEARAGGGIKGRLFQWSAGVSRSRAAATGPARGLDAARVRVADALVLDKVRDALGGRLTHVVCGGSRLSPETARFFLGLGVRVMEGYGATETAGPLTCNTPVDIRPGSVGIPYPGSAARIAEDGEVLAQGLGLFHGYHGRPDETAEAMVGGWYRTGDLGSIDAQGHLTITGRKKEILVTASGKNVQPAGLEDAIRPDALVQEVVVVGDDRPFVAALIAVDQAMLPAWLTARRLPSLSLPDAIAHPDVRAHLQAVVDHANSFVSRAESIREWRVLPRELTEQAGELSAALKVRRRIVVDHFADVVADIYRTA